MNEPERTMAQGLFHVLEPLALQYEERIRAIQTSQVALSSQIDVLTKEMDKCIHDVDFLDISDYIKKLQSARNKALKVSQTLSAVSERLQRLTKQARLKYPELDKLQQHNQQQKLLQQQRKEAQDLKQQTESTLNTENVNNSIPSSTTPEPTTTLQESTNTNEDTNTITSQQSQEQPQTEEKAEEKGEEVQKEETATDNTSE